MTCSCARSTLGRDSAGESAVRDVDGLVAGRLSWDERQRALRVCSTRQVPGSLQRDAVGQADSRAPAQQLAGLGDGAAGGLHVAGLRRLAVDGDLAADLAP